MNFEVWDTSKPDVSFEPAQVTFPAFEFYKKQAQLIAEQIGTTEVTEENIKEVKQLLADARKVSDGLSRRRIDIKKEILTQYEVFEAQVKDLASIIDTADSELRTKLRLLENAERDRKLKEIEELWGKRIGSYQIGTLSDRAFDMWLDPKMLNKSTPMKVVETDMVEWLEDSEKAINTLKSMDDEFLVEYLGCFNLMDAINAVNARREIKAKVTETKDEDTREKAIFIVYGKKDIKLTETLLSENEIEYTKQ